jgi:hypothetical protein
MVTAVNCLAQLDPAHLANPHETIAGMREHLRTSFQNAEALDAYLEGLRRAGLPAE